MIPKGLFTQIGMMVIAVALIITYVQPSFAEIGETQDSITVYQEEKDKVVEVNSQLANLTSRLESISNDDKRKLFTYMPDTVDEVAVPRDLLLIANQAGVLYKNSVSLGPIQNNSSAVDDTDMPQKHAFALLVEGTYGQIKNLFTLLEQNDYPLEVSSVNIVQVDGGFLAADIQIVTYSYKERVISNQIVF